MKDIWLQLEKTRKDAKAYELLKPIEEALSEKQLTPEQLFELDAQARNNVVAISAYSIFATAKFIECGEQVFAVTPWQQQLFEQTDLPKGDVDVQYPYPCFYLALPERQEVLWGGNATGWHRIGGAYVVQDPLSKGITVVVIGRTTEKSRNMLDDAALFFTIKPKDFGDLEGWLDRISKVPVSHNEYIDASDDNRKELDARNQVFSVVGRLVLNFLVYMTTPAPDVSMCTWFDERRRYLSKKKGKKAAKELRSLPTTPIRIVGGRVQKTAAARVREAKDVALHWVRGHYRRYHVGKGRARVELRFVSPFLRGTVPGEDGPRVYKVM